MAETDDPLQQTITSVETVQNLDPQTIARTETLGRAFDFTAAVQALRRVVAFFQQIPLKRIPELPQPQRDQIRSNADHVLKMYETVMAFDPAKAANASPERDALISQFDGAYTTVFTNLFPIVSYLGALERDISEIEREARAAVKAAQDQATELTTSMKAAEEETRRVLTEIRKTAAEAGVSQQAHQFAGQATTHSTAASEWQTYTLVATAVLVVFAAVSVFFGRYWLVPDNTYEAIQLAVSKVLIFSTIAFLLFLAARTMMAHRHNEVVNRHRQNALLTFNALVEAASSEQTREVVLTHASACIFAPQESGFSKSSGSQPNPSLIEILPRIMGSQQTGGGA